MRPQFTLKSWQRWSARRWSARPRRSGARTPCSSVPPCSGASLQLLSHICAQMIIDKMFCLAEIGDKIRYCLSITVLISQFKKQCNTLYFRNLRSDLAWPFAGTLKTFLKAFSQQYRLEEDLDLQEIKWSAKLRKQLSEP